MVYKILTGKTHLYKADQELRFCQRSAVISPHTKCNGNTNQGGHSLFSRVEQFHCDKRTWHKHTARQSL